MLYRILAFVILALTLYVLAYVYSPTSMTTYGISGLNSAIVSAQSGISWLKSFGSPTQVYDNTKTTVNGYIDTTKKTITDTQATIEKKVEQVNTAVDSLKKASDAIDEAQSAIAKIKS